MFYQIEGKVSRAAVVFTPEESKRFIAKAVVELPEVKKALREGIVIIGGGSTNGWIAREITGHEVDIERYTIGRIYNGELSSTPEELRLKNFVIFMGKPSEMTPDEALDKFSTVDVFIKGANAVDHTGNVGVLAANPAGGTVGAFWAKTLVRGANIICPVGLEKLVPSVEKACYACGQGRWDYCMGHRVGLLPMAGARVVTEIEAMKVLFDLKAIHIASGGVLGSEGSVTLAVMGKDDDVHRMWKDVSELKTGKTDKAILKKVV